MFGLDLISNAEEAAKVFDSLTFDVEFTEGNGDGVFVGYCVENPEFYFISDTAEKALEGVMAQTDLALIDFVLDYLDDGEIE